MTLINLTTLQNILMDAIFDYCTNWSWICIRIFVFIGKAQFVMRSALRFINRDFGFRSASTNSYHAHHSRNHSVRSRRYHVDIGGRESPSNQIFWTSKLHASKPYDRTRNTATLQAGSFNLKEISDQYSKCFSLVHLTQALDIRVLNFAAALPFFVTRLPR